MKLSRRIFCLFLTCVLMMGTMSVTAFAKGDIYYGIGFTTGSGLRLRSTPSTNGKVLDSAEKGEVITIISKSGSWFKVNYNLQVGYMHGDYLKVATKENAELGYGKINGSSVNLRSGAGTGYSKVAVGSKHDKVYILGLNEGWFKVIYGDKICYIRSDYVDLTEIPYENKDSKITPKFYKGGKSTGVSPSADALQEKPVSGSNNISKPESNVTVSGQAIVTEARKYLGTGYVAGGASPSGFDCSGFVYYVLKQLGYAPARTPADQYKMGNSVAKASLKPGDIVFFQNTYKAGISHVGIYVGNGQFIHAPNSRSVVSYSDLTTGYWSNHYYGARRITN